MPVSPLTTITRAATRQDGEPLNILTFVTHERYEPNLCKTGHKFYSLTGDGIRNWNTQYASIPDNYHIIDANTNENPIPLQVDIDLILCQNVMAQYSLASQLADFFQVPLINLWHTLPPINWTPEELQFYGNLACTVDVFISDYNKGVWGKNDSNAISIYHGVDTDFWKPLGSDREQRMMSVVNDWINRDWCCGYQIWERTARGLPCHIIGDTPGLSEPAESLEALRKDYSESQIFVNTSTHSPIPCSLLEAMACGCAVISTATCLIPEIIENVVNGFCTNDENEMRKYMVELLNNPELCQELGKAARQTIQEKFSMDRFVGEWNSLFWNLVDA